MGEMYTLQASNMEKSRLLSYSCLKMLSSEVWSLGDRAFRDAILIQLFKKMKECRIKNLLLDYNKMPFILKKIDQPVYSELITIFLGDNAIASIQHIDRICMPKLQSLHLNDNHISCVSPIRRCNMPNLVVLSIRENKLSHENHYVCLTPFNGSFLREILLDYKNRNLVDEPLAWLNKTNWVTPMRMQPVNGNGSHAPTI